jgi:CheY-like chemotaxis protein
MVEKTEGPPPLNILVADDELNIRKTLAVYLETEGRTVRVLRECKLQ